MIKFLMFCVLVIVLATPLIMLNLDPRIEVSTSLLGLSLLGFFLMVFVLYYLFSKKSK